MRVIVNTGLHILGESQLTIDEKLNSHVFFASGEHYALFDQMRIEDPVHWTASPDERGYWSVFRHADVKAIFNEPVLFSSEREGAAPALDNEMSAIASDAWGLGQNIAMIDPPRHAGIRKVIAAPFLPKPLADSEAQTKQLISDIFDDIPAHGEIDLVHDLAVRIPMAVICDILELPAEDWDDMLDWGKMAIGGTDPEYQQGSAAETVAHGFGLLYDYGMRRSSERRGCPFSDPLSLLANATVDGQPLSPSLVAYNAVQMIVAGFETTRNAFSGGVLALLEHPEQMAMLRADPHGLRLATEEIVRWSDPVISLMRVATADTRLGGHKIREGDRLILWLPSANRDEEVFERPYEFDITRHPNLHLGFGAGPHFCLGGPLAKMEIRLALEELLSRYDGIEITGPIERVQSNFVGGLKHLPVKLKPRASAP
ncbi:MAG: cytochrome P450 [Gammaproteobacteria bacterium]|jgi:cytochrome P450